MWDTTYFFIVRVSTRVHREISYATMRYEGLVTILIVLGIQEARDRSILWRM